MPTTCRGDFWVADNSPECVTANRDFSQTLQCENNTGPRCVHGTPVSSLDSAPCELTPNELGNKVTRCTGVALAPPARNRGSRFQPFTCIHLLNGLTDSDGDGDPFFAVEAYRTFLSNDSLILEYEPCTGVENYCEGASGTCVQWITRVFRRYVNGKDWVMECNEIEKCDRGSFCDQLVRKTLSFRPPGNGKLGFLFFNMTTKPQCFGPLHDTFCYLSECPPSDIDLRVLDCIGSVGSGDRARALDRLFVDMDIGWNNASPFVYGVDVNLVNAMFQQFNELTDQMDNPGHDSTNDWEGNGAVPLWFHEETFDELNPGQDEVYPAVRGGPKYYSEFDGKVIPLQAWLPEANLALPCEWTFQSSEMTANLHVEHIVASISNFEYRLTGNVIVDIKMRVRLLPEAYNLMAASDYLFLNSEDPYDLRVRRRDDTTKIAYLMIVGPGEPVPVPFNPATSRKPIRPTRGETARINRLPIWSQKDGSSNGIVFRWEGLKTTQALSMGPNTFQPTCLALGEPCCGTLQCINDQLITGKTDNNTGLQEDGTFIAKPQRYKGTIGFGVPGLNTAGSGVGCNCA